MKTALIVRRVLRKSLSIWAWSAYNPTKAQPSELKFDLLDGSQKRIGEIAYTSFQLKLMSPLKVSMTTPWGEASVDYKGTKPRIFLNGREVAVLGGSLFKKGFDLILPNERTLKFSHLNSGKNDVQYSEESGQITGTEESGTLPEGMSGHSIQLTREEIKMIPKADRPRSIETRDFKQFRISTSGTFSVNEEEIVRSLTIFVSYGMLVDEING